MSDIAIKVEGVSKQYRLGQIGTGSLAHDVNRWWYRIRGKEDPYLRVGEKNDRTQKGQGQYVWALKDVDFEVKKGEVLGIIGRNGAGKSTLLKILSRTTTPSVGSVKIRGRVASLLEVGTGFHPELTGRENIFLNGAILGMTKREIKSKFDEIVDFAGVERYVDTPVKRFSSGMYVRLAFGVAAHLESEILIVDEVLAVGDGEFQKKCLGKMREVSTNEGRTVLFVSHQMGTIANLCTRAILMQNGELTKDGITTDVINYYLSKANEGVKGGYIADAKKVGMKECYFKEVFVVNSSGEVCEQFGFGDQIIFKMQIVINHFTNNTFIGIGLQDKNNTRVSTFVKKLSDFTPNHKGEVNVSVLLPKEMIAPNHYSFIFALFEPVGKVYDVLENICPIQIIDTGTEYSVFEGLDYGSFIVNAKWQSDETNIKEGIR